MKRIVFLFVVFVSAFANAQAQAPSAPAHTMARYGNNAVAGKYFTHDGVKLYYEVYGTGEPLLVIHGNGGSIGSVREQIAYFRKQYKVIAMDSRDRGKSGDSVDKITYEKMADDLDALLVHLNAGPAYVLGWSDGAIEALLLAERHPEKVKKIAAMAANLNPTQEAVYPEVIAWVKQSLAAGPDSQINTPQWRHTAMILEEPHIDPKALEAITVPTLVLAGDHDMIRDEHTLEIYHHLPNGELAIFPHATHMIPFDDPQMFNTTVDRFFRTTFVKIDRVADTLKSMEKLRSGAKK
jgi:pimeloyl-ACP methyl ester carboxylesterase